MDRRHNREVADRAITYVFRPAVLRHIRARLWASFPAGPVDALRRPFRSDWQAMMGKLRERQAVVGAAPTDDFDALDVNNFRTLFEAYFDVLVPPTDHVDRRAERSAFLDRLTRIGKLRNAVAHPVERDLSYDDVYPPLADATWILRRIGDDDAIAALEELKAEASGSPRSVRAPRSAARRPKSSGVRGGLAALALAVLVGAAALLRPLVEPTSPISSDSHGSLQTRPAALGHGGSACCGGEACSVSDDNARYLPQICTAASSRCGRCPSGLASVEGACDHLSPSDRWTLRVTGSQPQADTICVSKSGTRNRSCTNVARSATPDVPLEVTTADLTDRGLDIDVFRNGTRVASGSARRWEEGILRTALCLGLQYTASNGSEKFKIGVFLDAR